MAKQLDTMWQYAQTIADKELPDTALTDFTAIDAEKVKATVAQIDAAIKDKLAHGALRVTKAFKQKLNYLKKN